ncbi:hypothetical protein ILUMI_16961 [Ignelater luminosus]|uniref:HAT C-terminal dimerisation domain-containing protein n=1 Tax=Ignelater luminosus TaxID=2038154 RepID=A0A8K0G5H1_IGNLU|nr:hypothetical protein ILUMI_16961 [Ignelater luminosus]
MIHLSSSKACLKLPRNVEDFLRSVGAHFMEIHKILAPAETRWLSVKACVDRVLEQYISLKAYLAEAVFSDPSKTIEEMLMTTNNQLTVVYLEFMSHVLSLVTNFNTLFQSETSLLHKLKPELENLLKTLNATHFLGLDEINIRVKTGESMENLKKDEDVPRAAIADFYETCQKFSIELTSDKLSSLKLNHWRLCLDDEWRAHAMLDFAQHGLELHRDNIDAGQYLFPIINIVMSLLLILPFSNASVERKFSDLKNLKTENRNRLNTDTVVSLMATRGEIKKLDGSVKFNPSSKMLATKKKVSDLKDKDKYYLNS